MGVLTIAVAKGRTAEQTISILKKCGIIFPSFHDQSRKLIFFDQTEQVKLIYVKAFDVPVYVEKGAADIGIAGKDNILEQQADVYELLDLKFGTCKFVLAGPSSFRIERNKRLLVATKYPAASAAYFKHAGIQADTIKLNGSVELAPLVGLSDIIADIVETGTTLKENGLEIIEEIAAISTRLIVNKASFATKTDQIHRFIDQLNTVLEANKFENSSI